MSIPLIQCEFKGVPIVFEEQIEKLRANVRNIFASRYGLEIKKGRDKPTHMIKFEDFDKLSMEQLKEGITKTYKLERERLLEGDCSSFHVVCDESDFPFGLILTDCEYLKAQEAELVANQTLTRQTSDSIFGSIIRLHIYRILSCVADEDDIETLARLVFILETELQSKAKTAAIKAKKIEPFILQGTEVTADMIPLNLAMKTVMKHMFEVDLPDDFSGNVENFKNDPRMKMLMTVLKPALTYFTSTGEKNPQEMMTLFQSIIGQLMGNMGGGMFSGMFGGNEQK